MTQEELLQLMRTTPHSFDDLTLEGKGIIANLVRPATEAGFTPEQQRLIDEWFLVADMDAMDAIAFHNLNSPFKVSPIYNMDLDEWLIPSIVFTDARPDETYSDLWITFRRLKFKEIKLSSTILPTDL